MVLFNVVFLKLYYMYSGQIVHAVLRDDQFVLIQHKLLVTVRFLHGNIYNSYLLCVFWVDWS